MRAKQNFLFENALSKGLINLCFSGRGVFFRGKHNFKVALSEGGKYLFDTCCKWRV